MAYQAPNSITMLSEMIGLCQKLGDLLAACRGYASLAYEIPFRCEFLRFRDDAFQVYFQNENRNYLAIRDIQKVQRGPGRPPHIGEMASHKLETAMASPVRIISRFSPRIPPWWIVS
jgi:hypothetical protein